MQLMHRAEPYFPDDNWLPIYENSVRTVVFRRFIQFLFNKSVPIPIADILRETNASLNSIAAAYIELNKHGYVEKNDAGISLTKTGKRWALRERRSLFWPRVVVRYRSSIQQSFAGATTEKSLNNKMLPANYRLPRD